jgi:ATP-dependent DNA helicase RecG
VEEKVGREMNVVKDVIFEGTVLDQINQAVNYLETQVKEYSYLGEDGLFVTEREYPKFVIQEMCVNSVCHRDYSIKGTEIQIKMFDDRLVFETPGRLPGIVRVDNIRHTHFSRNPKIAEFLKAYDYVKEFGEGVDRMCNELASEGIKEPHYNLVAFILKATVLARIIDKKGIKGHKEDIKKGIKKGIKNNEILIENILQIIKENPKISYIALAEATGASYKIVRNVMLELVQSHIITRVGPKRGGTWEIESDK